jgi:hypothetical protein
VTVVARRRRQLQRGYGHQRVHHTRAHLEVPLIATTSVSREDGGGHGGARPRVGQLQRVNGIRALLTYPTSICISNCT